MSTLTPDALAMPTAAADRSAPVVARDSGISPSARTAHAKLTRREREVLLLLGQRLTDREIGGVRRNCRREVIPSRPRPESEGMEAAGDRHGRVSAWTIARAPSCWRHWGKTWRTCGRGWSRQPNRPWRRRKGRCATECWRSGHNCWQRRWPPAGPARRDRASRVAAVGRRASKATARRGCRRWSAGSRCAAPTTPVQPVGRGTVRWMLPWG